MKHTIKRDENPGNFYRFIYNEIIKTKKEQFPNFLIMLDFFNKEDYQGI
jgi:hypothetical protein